MEEHRAALRYDWRTRFGMSLDSVPSEIGWSEAVDLVRVIRSDPSSQLAMSVEGWDYPMPREAAILADLYDLEHAKTGVKNRKPYPRPYAVEDREVTRHGRTGGRTPEQIKDLLKTAFGQPEVAPV